MPESELGSSQQSFAGERARQFADCAQFASSLFAPGRQRASYVCLPLVIQHFNTASQSLKFAVKFKVCDSSVVCIDHLFASSICLHRSWCTLSSDPGVLFASIRAIEVASAQPIWHRGGNPESFLVAPQHPRVFLHPSHPRPLENLCFPSPFCIACTDVCILSVHRLLYDTPLKVCRTLTSPGWMDSLLSKDRLST